MREQSPKSKAVELSERLYKRLLAAYPKEHRAQYGFAMEQLFRDQCRDEWSRARGWGLMKHWLRVLPDLLQSSVLEHLENLKRRNAMFNLFGRRSAPLASFLSVFTIVFLLVVGTAVLVTFILPESYRSTARLLIIRGEGGTQGDSQGFATFYDPYWIQTEFEIIQSEVVLRMVIDNLNLKAKWAARYGGGTPLTTSECLDLLRLHLDLHPVRNTSIIQVSAFSGEPREAAAIANAIAEASVRYQREQTRAGAGTRTTARLEIIDQARPELRPYRPDKPLNIFLGVVLGTLLGSLAGAGAAGLNLFRGWKNRKQAIGTSPVS